MKNVTRRDIIKKFAKGVTLAGSLSLLAPLAMGGGRGVKGRAPALFIGHGDPNNALQDNSFTLDWDRMAKRLSSIQRPKAILCVSAHWETYQTRVTTTLKPDMIYDFYGFPEELYQVQYPVSGFPESHTMLSDVTQDIPLTSDSEYGLDHGSWTVLSRLFPKADIPVFQLSLSRSLSARAHYTLGQQIGLLRNRGVLILGSGNLVHNMHSWRYDASRGRSHLIHDWAREFDWIVADAIVKRNHDRLIRMASESPQLFRLAHPTPEHYLPLLYMLGARHKMDEVEFFSEGFEEGSFSMRSVLLT